MIIKVVEYKDAGYREECVMDRVLRYNKKVSNERNKNKPFNEEILNRKDRDYVLPYPPIYWHEFNLPRECPIKDNFPILQLEIIRDIKNSNIPERISVYKSNGNTKSCSIIVMNDDGKTIDKFNY